MYSRKLEKRINNLPALIRTIAVLIIKKGFNDLYSVDNTQGLVVVPRGLVINDFTASVLKQLENDSGLVSFPGLSRRVIRSVCIEAEEILFRHITRGRTVVDPDYRGICLEVDTRFSWKLNETDGHYYYALSFRNGQNLNQKKELNRLKKDMADILVGQKRYLKSLAEHQLFDIAEAFRGR